MSKRAHTRPVAVLAAGCAAVGLYALVHDAIGIPPHAIIAGSFGSATFLAIACVIATVTKRRTK